MRLTVLIDNYSDNDKFIMEHGLSYYIDTGKSKILFDTGQSDAFVHNALKLGIDISAVDYQVLSHGHSDHTGGLGDFLRNNSQAEIILKQETLNPKYSNNNYIGIPHEFQIPDNRVIKVGESYRIDPFTDVIGTILITYPDDTHYDHFYVKSHDAIVPDTFQDELFLSIKGDDGMAVITGCSHNGISNIIYTAQKKANKPVRNLIGGLHLKDSDRKSVIKIADYLNTTSVEKIITGHCTGMENYILLKNRCKAQVSYGFAGNSYPF